MSLPITIPNTFATETNNIPLSDLDANFTTVTNAINGIGNGSEALANVAITGGTIANVSITSGSITGITDLAVADGGTGASTAANARTNLGAAASGANSDITALSGLTTALSVAQGGTGSANLTAASVVIGNGTSAVTGVAPGTSGNLLTSNGTAWTSTASTAIGVGQTWQDVTGSRSAGTTYTNSTGRPIQVNISGRSNDLTCTLTLIVDGVSVHQSFFTFNIGTQSNPGTLTAIVPAGSTYSVTASGYVIQIWSELR
jgi:hypothetical protein